MPFTPILHFLADFLRGIDAAVFVLCALVFVCDWIRRRLYLPAYIHVMATITFVGSWALLRWMILCYPPESPPGKWEVAGLALFLALIVYVVFVLYGGAGAAWDAKQEQAQNAGGDTWLSRATVRQNARAAMRERCVKRLHLGGLTVLLFALTFANAALFGLFFYGFAPLWGALLAGVLLWVGATALFLFSQTFGPVDLVNKHLILFATLLVLLYGK